MPRSWGTGHAARTSNPLLGAKRRRAHVFGRSYGRHSGDRLGAFRHRHGDCARAPVSSLISRSLPRQSVQEASGLPPNPVSDVDDSHSDERAIWSPPKQESRRPGALAIGAVAAGAIALGFVAFAAIAIGRLVIGSLTLGSTEAREMRVNHLTIGNLKLGRIGRS